jgi:hypothetical protein
VPRQKADKLDIHAAAKDKLHVPSKKTIELLERIRNLNDAQIDKLQEKTLSVLNEYSDRDSTLHPNRGWKPSHPFYIDDIPAEIRSQLSRLSSLSNHSRVDGVNREDVKTLMDMHSKKIISYLYFSSTTLIDTAILDAFERYILPELEQNSTPSQGRDGDLFESTQQEKKKGNRISP